MSASLDGLPPELLENIADLCLEHEENTLLQLRSTCRTVEAGTHRTWVSAYFYLRRLSLEPAKLAELRDIGSVPALAHEVVQVEVVCKDDAQLLGTDENDASLTTAAAKLGPLLTRAFQNLEDLVEVSFVPEEPADAHAANEEHTIDFSATCSLVLWALQTCGLSPYRLSAINLDVEKTFFFINKSSAMVQIGDCCPRVMSLELCLGAPDHFTGLHNQTHEAFADSFAQAVVKMPYLQSIKWVFASSELGLPVLKRLSKIEPLPYLYEITVASVGCQVRDLSKFLLKHATTLKTCNIMRVMPLEGDPSREYRDLLETFHSTFNLHSMMLGLLEDLNGARFDFPVIDLVICEDNVNEDGFIEVALSPFMHFEGAQEVKDGVERMLNSMVVR